MPKRSEKRDAAKAEYLARKGRGELVDLRELAEGLGVNYQTLRNWKSADEWEKAEPKKHNTQTRLTFRKVHSFFSSSLVEYSATKSISPRF